jgi:flagella basal body P-ring formation protein FlgA
MNQPALKPSIRSWWLPAAMGVVLALVSITAQAEIEAVENIRLAAERFIQEELNVEPGDEAVEVQIGRLDNRLRLARCSEALETRFPPGGRRDGNTAVQVQCEAPVSWSIYVPVTVERYAEVLVASRNLRRQHTILPGDLRTKRIQTSRHAGSYFETKSELVGLQTRRNIRPGQILGQQHVTQREVVSRGQRVTILAENSSVVIRMQGEALENGILGDRIRVKNTSSGRVVEGEVLESGHVRVAL